MTRGQRRWHLLVWLVILPVAVAVLLLAEAQWRAPAGLGTPELPEEVR